MDSVNINLLVWAVVGALGSLVVILWDDQHTEAQLMRDLLVGIVGGVLFGGLLWGLQLLRGLEMADVVYLPNAVIALVGAVALVVGLETRRQN